MSLLCGDTPPTSGLHLPCTNTPPPPPPHAPPGSARVCGHNVSLHPLKAWQSSGFCPQFDALFDNLTVQVSKRKSVIKSRLLTPAQEHLEFFGLIRGVAAGLSSTPLFFVF